MSPSDLESIWLATRRFVEPRLDGGWAFRNEHLFPDSRLEGINLGSAGILIGLLALREAFPEGGTRDELDAGLRKTGYGLARMPCAERSAGLFTGDAGVAIALTALGLAARDEQFLQAGWRRFTNALSICEEFDFFSGSAGLLFAAALLTTLTGDRRWVDSAREQAALLASELRVTRGILGISASGKLNGNQDLFLGAAHGSSGLALALHHFGKAADDPRMSELAGEIVTSLLEHGFDESSGLLNASVSPNRSQPSVSDAAWCHGSLGLMWCLGQIDDLGRHLSTAHASRLEQALLRVIHARRYDNPTLCHGVAGQLETLQLLAGNPAFAEFSPELHVARERSRGILEALRHPFSKPNSLPWASEDPETFTPDL